MASLIVDHREPLPLKSLVGGVASFANLGAGDFEFRLGSETKLLIERKELDDLMSSLVDGRFDQQKAKLSEQASNANHPIGFIIEGDWREHPERRTIESVMMTTRFRDGFNVITTEDIDETAHVVLMILDLFGRGKMNPLDERELMQRMVRARSTHRVTQFSSVSDWWVCAIGLVPGIGAKAAEAIAAQYPNPDAMSCAFADAVHPQTAMQSVKVGKRRLGPSKAKKLWECFSANADGMVPRPKKKKKPPAKGREPPPSEEGCLFLPME